MPLPGCNIDHRAHEFEAAAALEIQHTQIRGHALGYFCIRRDGWRPHLGAQTRTNVFRPIPGRDFLPPQTSTAAVDPDIL
jgi:hypothetical protein